jgi:hypothetical protein
VLDIARDANALVAAPLERIQNHLNARAIAMIGVILDGKKYFHPIAKLACP